MASSQLEDGALIPSSTTGGLVFDVAVFRTYLESLLPLGAFIIHETYV